MLRSAYVGSAVISLAASFASPARAQCLDFAAGFTTPGVVGPAATSTDPVNIDGRVLASALFDDGTGEALYVCGRFRFGGEVSARSIARWDGTGWSAVGGAFPDQFPALVVSALVVYDDGNGPALYAGGNMTTQSPLFIGGVMKWDGTSWSIVGGGMHMGSTSNEVTALAVYDSGAGPELYAGGRFSQAGGVPVANIAKWNGSAWSAVGSGIPAGSITPVNAMLAFDDGSGAQLYVGGGFASAGGAPNTSGLARWDGSAWSGFSPFTGNGVNCMAIYDDDSGPALFIGGTFSSGSGVQGIAKWDGSSFTTMNGPFATIQALGVFDDGSGHGRELYAGGTWNSTAFGVAAKGIVRYDGTSWRDVGPGLGLGFTDGQSTEVHTIRKFGESLYVGGLFGNAGTLAVNDIASWDGASWSALGSGEGIGGDVHALTLHDDGSGPALYAAGRFRTAGSTPVSHIAKWDGSGWARVGSQNFYSNTTPFTVLASFDDGSGPQLFAGGDIGFPFGSTYNLARFDGTNWSGVGGVPDFVRALAVYDPPGATDPTLYIAGEFGEVLRWNGAGTSLVAITNGSIEAMAVYDDLSGSGPKLFIGGPFTTVDGVPASGAAAFDGTNWTAPAGGTGSPVYAFAVYHDGTGGPSLYAAVGSSLRRWNGSTWTVVGDANLNGVIDALAVSGDGTSNRPSLYVGGLFTSIGGVSAQNLARWNGSAWSAVVGAADGRVRALCAFRDNTDSASDLYVGGEFEVLDGLPTRAVAKYVGCTGPGTSYCFADGTLATACPCAAPFVVPSPQGSAFGGCASSFNPHGGSLTAVGATNPDTVTLHATGLTPAGFTVFIKSDALSGGFASHDGVRCTGGAFVRFGSQNAVNGTARYPNPSLGLTLPLSVVGSTPPGSGLAAYYQPFYRNVTANFCNAGTINFTNTYGVNWN